MSEWEPIPNSNMASSIFQNPFQSKPKPPITTIGTLLEMPIIHDIVDGLEVTLRVNNVSFIPYFRRFTPEELRYFDYVAFEKIPHWTSNLP